MLPTNDEKKNDPIKATRHMGTTRVGLDRKLDFKQDMVMTGSILRQNNNLSRHGSDFDDKIDGGPLLPQRGSISRFQCLTCDDGGSGNSGQKNGMLTILSSQIRCFSAVSFDNHTEE